MNEIQDTYFRGARELLSSNDCIKLGMALIKASCRDLVCDEKICPMYKVCLNTKAGFRPDNWEVVK